MEEAMIQVGQKAPSFEVEDNDGQKIELSDLTGTGTVFYFYPKDLSLIHI